MDVLNKHTHTESYIVYLKCMLRFILQEEVQTRLNDLIDEENKKQNEVSFGNICVLLLVAESTFS